MPARAVIVERLRSELRAIRPELPASWPEAALFKADLALDSLDLVELVARAEQQWGVFVPDGDLKEMVSLQAMGDYFDARVAA
jgi:acyl carrier protein